MSVVLNPYKATPAITFEKLARNPIKFKERTKFSVSLFITELLMPLWPFIDQPRSFYYNNTTLSTTTTNNSQIEIRTTRGSFLTVPDRLLRAILYLRKEGMQSLIDNFDQGWKIVRLDCIHICFSMLYGIGHKWLKPFDPTSDDFASEFGKGILRNFPGAIGVVDVMKAKFV